MKNTHRYTYIFFLIISILLYYSCGSSHNKFKVERGAEIDNKQGVIVVGDSNSVQYTVNKIINTIEITNQNQIINHIHKYKDSLNYISKIKDSIYSKIAKLEKQYINSSKKQRKRIKTALDKEKVVKDSVLKKEMIYNGLRGRMKEMFEEKPNEEKTDKNINSKEDIPIKAQANPQELDSVLSNKGIEKQKKQNPVIVENASSEDSGIKKNEESSVNRKKNYRICFNNIGSNRDRWGDIKISLYKDGTRIRSLDVENGQKKCIYNLSQNSVYSYTYRNRLIGEKSGEVLIENEINTVSMKNH